MHYTFTTPPASRAADRPTQIDDALVADARRLLLAAVKALPPETGASRVANRELFAGASHTLCTDGRERGVPIEKLIIAIKLAWASLPEIRLRLGENGPDALAGMVTACIEEYFATEPRGRAD
jgi:hypothetical protein